jgi:PKD repeat protein
MVTEPWDESTITWINQPEVSDAIHLVLHTSSYPEENYLNLDVTDMIRAMYQEPEYYFGFCLQLQIEWPYRSMTFISSNFSEPELRPKLMIVYKQCENPVAGFEFEVFDERTVTFIDNSTSAETWLWDFGDGYQSNLQNPHHTYDDYGFYNVCLYISDSCGESFFCDTVTTCNFTLADFGFTMVDLEVLFTDSSKNTTGWWWDFGDGYYSDLQNTSHKFPDFDTYEVCLKASNDCSSDIFCDSITVVNTQGFTENQMLPLRIFPNPVTSCLYLELGTPFGTPELLNIKILSQSGSVLMQSKVADSESIKFELQTLQAGLYIFYVTSSSGYFANKFIKL